MANSIKTYSAVADAAYVYTTPEYLESADIKVYVDDVLQPASAYTLSNTALTFNSTLTEGQEIRIERQSDKSSRLVSYTDGSLLNAETLDKDANQIFNVAQEAYDQSRITNMAAGEFYYSQDDAPENPKAGLLWYNTRKTPNVLEVYDGTDWQPAAPVYSVVNIDNTHPLYTEVAGVQDLVSMSVESWNKASRVFLNGVKLIEATSENDIPTNGDYYYKESEYSLYFMDLADGDILTVETMQGAYTTEMYEKEAEMSQLYTDFKSESDVAVPLMNQIIALDLTTRENNLSSLATTAEADRDFVKKYATHPVDSSFVNEVGETEFSAKHYADEAKDQADLAAVKATETSDPLRGWFAVDNETIKTSATTSPILYSDDGIELNAVSDIDLKYGGDLKFNGSSAGFPFAVGTINLQASVSDSERWTGNVTGMVLKVGSVTQHRFQLSLDGLGNADTYMVMLTPMYERTHTGHYELTAYATNYDGYFEVEVESQFGSGLDANPNSFKDGKCNVVVYKL